MTRAIVLAIFFITGCGGPHDNSPPEILDGNGAWNKSVNRIPPETESTPEDPGPENYANVREMHLLAISNQCVKWVEYLGYGCYRFKCRGNCGDAWEMLLSKCGTTECDPFDPGPYNPGYPEPNGNGK